MLVIRILHYPLYSQKSKFLGKNLVFDERKSVRVTNVCVPLHANREQCGLGVYQFHFDEPHPWFLHLNVSRLFTKELNITASLVSNVHQDVLGECTQCGRPSDSHRNCVSKTCNMLFIQWCVPS